MSLLFMSLIRSLPQGEESFLAGDHARRKNVNKVQVIAAWPHWLKSSDGPRGGGGGGGGGDT